MLNKGQLAGWFFLCGQYCNDGVCLKGVIDEADGFGIMVQVMKKNATYRKAV